MLNKTFAFVVFCVTSLFLNLLLVGDAHADSPLQPPHKITRTNQNQQYQIISDPLLGTQVLDKNNKLLWKMSGWFRAPSISNDGEYCVTEYDGLNLIPQDYSHDMVMLTFWKHGKVLRKVRLKEIIPDKRILKETVSHYYWGYGAGIDEHGKFIVQTADEKRLFFDIRTGKLATP
ncbi:hypothetical protein ACO0LL_14025 [Undibacterium sp. TC4M20W]|uniref:hypothetical protein n=1 Tax=Undibacterium sp. TC4M20W TaxID=3413052 RepID=UPI003BF2EE1A